MKTISREQLAGLVADLLRDGTPVIAPVVASDTRIDYRFITNYAEIDLGGELPRRSLKEVFLPPTEPLFAWKQTPSGVEISEVPTQFQPRVVLGAKPCDAAALEVLDKVMSWDFQDELWFGRRASTTIIAIGCPEKKHGCFCDEVGIGPSSTRGSDLFFTPRADGSFRVDIVTPKGEALVRAYPDRFSDAPDEPSEPPKGGAKDEHLVLSLPKIREWLEENFDHKLWETSGLRCTGCGSCAAVCPTCHCFDIVDEPEGSGEGTRRRNWDSCQSCRFTVHASGYNPREDQKARIRQRVMHKFFIYPERFGEVLCTGCGRCSRNCPSGVDLDEILQEIDALISENPESHS